MPATTTDTWVPPETMPREIVIAESDRILALPEIRYTVTEDVFRIEELGMEWDIGVQVYEPIDPGQIAVGADARKIGAFLLHGGQDDWRQMEPLARLLAGKFGWKVVAGTFPGRLYLEDPSRNWPGDTFRPDGSVRTPIWLKGEHISPDQYELVSDDSIRSRAGVRTLARALPGTLFYHRMAAWPAAMESGMIEANRRHFPAGEYSVYFQGHSTGGPMMSMLSQRVPNCAGVLAAENSPFGVINEQKHAWGGAMGKIGTYEKGTPRADGLKATGDPFTDLYLRSWRDLARYRGPEALGKEGPAALMRLPSLMEEILDEWRKASTRPLFKCEYMITHNFRPSLVAAAQATAARLGLDEERTKQLVDRFVGYTAPLSGPGVKPVPPFLFGISAHSRDHSREVYEEVVLPLFRTIEPAPKIALTQFMAGVHMIWDAEDGLPQGIMPTVASQWHQAITHGWYVS